MTNEDELECVVCGTKFKNHGSHPLTCGKQVCIMEAIRQGLIQTVEKKKKKSKKGELVIPGGGKK
jgi:hypothetical protein